MDLDDRIRTTDGSASCFESAFVRNVTLDDAIIDDLKVGGR